MGIISWLKKPTYSHHITGLQITGTPSAADHGFPPMVQQETMENLGEGMAKPLKGDVQKWRNIEAQQQTAKLIEVFKGHSKRGKVMKSLHISWWSQHFPMVFPWFSHGFPGSICRGNRGRRLSWLRPLREAFGGGERRGSAERNGGYHGDTGNIEGIIGIIYGE